MSSSAPASIILHALDPKSPVLSAPRRAAAHAAAVTYSNTRTSRRRTASVLYTLPPAAVCPADAAHTGGLCAGGSCCIALATACVNLVLTLDWAARGP